ncbi:MAG TPA: PEGA domain-containing protein, partial [Thermoanaerobaculia bacterium]
AGRIAVSSAPASADIEIDGSFVGNTPSVIEVAPGEHEIVIKKSGYQTWQRKMKIMSGNINVAAELEKVQ